MEIRSMQHRNRNLLALGVVIFLSLVVILVLEKTRTTDFIKDPTYQPASQQGPTEEELQQQEETQSNQKGDFIDNAQQNPDSKPAEVPKDTDSITIQPSQSGETVVIHNELHGQGYSSGSCTLTVQNGNATITQEAQIIYQPEYSMCAGFSVPVSSLGAGSWVIRLDVTPFNGDTLTKTNTIEVSV